MRRALASVVSACAAASVWSAVEVADGIGVARDASTGVVTVTYSLSATDGETEAIVTADLIGASGAVVTGALDNATGDVFRRVSVGPAHTFAWKPGEAVAGLSTGCSFRLTAWSLSSPPDYMVIDMTGVSGVSYYENAAQVSGGVKDHAYFLYKLLMRKIPAAQVRWHQGKAGTTVHQEQLQRWTTLTNDYYIGVYELTRGQYWCVDTTESVIRASNLRTTDVPMLMPAQGMNFNEIYGDGPSIDPNKWLGKAYTQTGVRLTLPTEAQWEYACRAGTAGERYGTLGSIAVYAGNAPTNASGTKIPAMGGTKLPNSWGLYDMIGNMFEYVLDWMNPSAYLSSEDALNPTGPAEYIDNTDLGHAGKMWRGGCFEYNSMLTATYPYAWYKWGALAKYNGLRLVCPARQ